MVGKIPGWNVDRSLSPATTPDVGVSGQCSDVLNNGQARFVAGTPRSGHERQIRNRNNPDRHSDYEPLDGGKAPPPPPPPPPPTQTCPVEAGIAFPALVYSKAKYKILKKFGGSQLYDGSDLYIANSTGTCSILIYPGTRDSSALSVSYRQIMENGSSVGHVAYVDGAGQQIKLLKFTVLKDADKFSVQGLPLSSSVVFAYNAPSSGINDVALSSDGQTIYFSDEQLTSDGRWIDTVNSLDVSTNCSPVCPKTVIFDEFPDNSGVAGLSINDDEDRLYMAIHFRVPDIRTISRLEKQTDGAWAFRNVVSDQDPGYPAVDGFASTALGIWNSRDVVAYVVERYSTGNTTDIIDV